MRKYTAELYKDLVEDIDDDVLQQFMRDEKEFIAGIPEVKSQTLVDLGAGYGRVVPFLAEVAKRVVAIEINPDMFPELERRAKGLPNVTATQGDFLKLGDVLPEDIGRPIFLILQNSLGTIEGGNSNDTLRTVTAQAANRNGQLVLSLFRQPALASWGVEMYGKLHGMVGAIDITKSDFDKGMMVTDTGYSTKWWTDEEIESFRNLGSVVREQQAAEYQFLQIAV